MEELKTAGKLFRTVLDRYLSVCSSIHNLYLQGGARNVAENHLDDIKAEILCFSSYEPKLSEARIAITKVCNSLSPFASINSLPLEIMIQIFQLVLASKSCNIGALIGPGTSYNRSYVRGEHFPVYPDCLAQVCTPWRQITLSSPSLWIHIDFTTDKNIHSEILTRAKVHAQCANTLPLVLHIYEGQVIDYNKRSLKAFLLSIAHRITILDFTVIDSMSEFTSMVFEGLLPGCASASSPLTQLVVTFIGECSKPHFRSGEDNVARRDLRLAISQSVIEDSLRHISVLHSCGLFSYWSSTAYNDLVDLHLIASSGDDWNIIPESDFCNILEASPKLRVLRFALLITQETAQSGPETPVHLEDLEVVGIATYRDSPEDPVLNPGVVLQLLAPGPKPLQLSIWNWDFYDPDDFSTNELKNILQRANVT
ncbi:hypothetical protein FRC11_011404, partial [Ceratobasidium sp. 423]